MSTKRSRQEASSEGPEAKRSFQEGKGGEEDSGCLIYIVSTRLSSGHLRHLKNVAGKKGFKLVDSLRYFSVLCVCVCVGQIAWLLGLSISCLGDENLLSDRVTHVVTSLPTYQRLLEVLQQ